MAKYMKQKAEDPSSDPKPLLSKAARRLKKLDQAMVGTYADEAGQLRFRAEAERIVFTGVLAKCAKAFEDLHDYRLEAAYAERCLAFDTCSVEVEGKEEAALRMCAGHYYNRLIIIYRHHLGLPHHATYWYEKALVAEVNGKRLHPWPNEWHIGLDFRPGLKSQPYWESGDRPALAAFLEEHYPTIKAEFLKLHEHPKYAKHWPQDNYYLTSEGDWSKLDVFQGTQLTQVCKAMPQTCQLLQSRPEVTAEPPDQLAHGGHRPQQNGVALFRLRPGSRLKPHTGPANYRLYCHLGLVVPPGPWLRVGPGEPREWREGGALCFDDSYVHEAWHNGTEDRYVMMVSYWHPDLAASE